MRQCWLNDERFSKRPCRNAKAMGVCIFRVRAGTCTLKCDLQVNDANLRSEHRERRGAIFTSLFVLASLSTRMDNLVAIFHTG